MHHVYSEMKQRLAKGWNTWNTRSVLSHVLLPEGLALNLGLKEYETGHYLKEALIGRFGSDAEVIVPQGHAYDGSFTELTLSWRKIKIKVQSACIGDELVVLITELENQLKPATLVIEPGMLWNRKGLIAATPDKGKLTAHLPGKKLECYITGLPVDDPYIAAQAAYLAVELRGEIGISVQTERSLAEVKWIIEQQKAKHEADQSRFGAKEEIYKAMQSCLAWDTIYDPSKDRVITPVSRLWNLSSGGYALFCWDTYFAALMIAEGHKDLAYSNAIEMTLEKTAAGFVPNTATATGFKTMDRSQPPVGSMVIRELYQKYQEKWLIELLFDDLLAWNTWFIVNRETASGSGVLAWGSNSYQPVTGNLWESEGVGHTYGGALESGLDNSPMYDGVPFDDEKEIMMLADVGLTGLFIMDSLALAELAAVLGRQEDVVVLEQRAASCETGLEQLWVEEQGMYCNWRTDTNEPSLRYSPTNFYALFSRKVSQERVKRILLEHLLNPDEFWGEWVLPSIARNDLAYKEQNYWRGRIWAPLNFLVYQALRNHDSEEVVHVRKSLADASERLILQEWFLCGHVHENYSADTGMGCGKENSDRFYHWGGLLALIQLMEVELC